MEAISPACWISLLSEREGEMGLYDMKWYEMYDMGVSFMITPAKPLKQFLQHVEYHSALEDR